MKYVFVDMDGTIAEWGYPDGRISGEYKFGDYIGKNPINDVIAEILNLYSGSEENQKEYIIMTVSAVPNSKAIMEKNVWLDNFFNIPYPNRIYISQNEDKVEVIKFYLENIAGVDPKGNSILIDDKKDILIKGNEFGMEVYHPTKIIALFQNRMAELQKQNQQNQENVESNNSSSVEEAQPTTEVEDGE